MILETNNETCTELCEVKSMVNRLGYGSISLYIDYFDLYSTLMTLVYKGGNRIVINSAISFFIELRNYILFSDDVKFDRKLVSSYYDKMLIRFMLLLKNTNQVIYLYKCSLEVEEFCEYYNFNYVVIDTHEELESLCKDLI